MSREAAGRAADLLTAASGILMALLLLALLALDLARVTMRYLLGTGWPWAGDLAIILLLSLAWIGAGHLWLRGAHIGIALLPDRSAGVMRILFGLLALAGGAVVLPMAVQTMTVYGAIDLPALPVPASAKYLPVAVGVAWVALAAALRLVAGRDAS